MRVEFDVDGVDALINELGTKDGELNVAFRHDVRDEGQTFTKLWRRDAAAKAGSHGKHYPNAIEPELTDGGLGVVIGPLSSKPQGDMNFEYGHPAVASKEGWPGAPFRGRRGWFGGPGIGQRVGQSKPHMSMNITADVEFPKFIERLSATTARVWR